MRIFSSVHDAVQRRLHELWHERLVLQVCRHSHVRERGLRAADHQLPPGVQERTPLVHNGSDRDVHGRLRGAFSVGFLATCASEHPSAPVIKVLSPASPDLCSRKRSYISRRKPRNCSLRTRTTRPRRARTCSSRRSRTRSLWRRRRSRSRRQAAATCLPPSSLIKYPPAPPLAHMCRREKRLPGSTPQEES